MSREIKFRIWDKDEKKMIFSDLWMWTPDTLWRYVADIDNESPPEPWIRRNVEIMQSVGLKDRNGKEIWEGDICKNGDWEDGANAYNYRTEVVQWRKDNAAFTGWNFNEDGMTCEIIGNIHENPELLKP